MFSLREEDRMKCNSRTIATIWALVLCAGTLFGQAPEKSSNADWQATLNQRLSVYGHRNWIIVADAAFPAYSESGIETIVANEDLPLVLKYVVGAIRSSKHLRATAFLDQELQFVGEEDYPGVTHLREGINGILTGSNTSSIPH